MTSSLEAAFDLLNADYTPSISPASQGMFGVDPRLLRGSTPPNTPAEPSTPEPTTPVPGAPPPAFAHSYNLTLYFSPFDSGYLADDDDDDSDDEKVSALPQSKFLASPSKKWDLRRRTGRVRSDGEESPSSSDSYDSSDEDYNDGADSTSISTSDRVLAHMIRIGILPEPEEVSSNDDEASDALPTDFQSLTLEDMLDDPIEFRNSRGPPNAMRVDFEIDGVLAGTEDPNPPEELVRYFTWKRKLEDEEEREINNTVSSEDDDSGENEEEKGHYTLHGDEVDPEAQYATLLPRNILDDYFKPLRLPVVPLSFAEPAPKFDVPKLIVLGRLSGVMGLTPDVTFISVLPEYVSDLPFEFGRAFAMKSYHIPGGIVRTRMLNEIAAYKRITAAPRFKNQGFMFVMELDFVIDDSPKIALVMEICPYDLRSIINDEVGVLNRVSNTKRLMAQMAVGIAFLHNIGIIHRDIHPSNVLIDFRGNIRITDFSQCILLPDTQQTYPRLRTRFGCHGYIAPESLGKNPAAKEITVGPAVDWWGLGCILFELEHTHGMPMFESDKKFDEWCKVGHMDGKGDVDFLSSTDMPRSAKDLIRGLLCPRPSRRYNLEHILDAKYFLACGWESSSLYDIVENASKRPQESVVLGENIMVRTPPSATSTKISHCATIPWVNPYGGYFDEFWGAGRHHRA